MFFSSFRPVQAIAVPRPVVLSTGSNGLRPYYDCTTGPSHAACNIGRDLHFRLDRYRDAALLYCITAVKIFHSTVATAAQLAVHKDSSGFEGNLIRQRHSCRFCLETCSCLTMEPLRGDSVSSATRTTGERSLQPPNPSSSPAPTSLTFGS